MIGESGESTPVSAGSETCALEDFAPETMDTTMIGDVADEEKTLTAYMKEEMARPRLAEIRWTNSDNPVQVLSFQNILLARVGRRQPSKKYSKPNYNVY